MKTKYKLLFIVGVIFSIYGISIALICGYNYWFNYFFLVLGLFNIVIALYHEQIESKVNKKLLKIIKVFLLICLIIFMVFEVICIGFSLKRNDISDSTIVVLGSGVGLNGEPSADFKGRLDKAWEIYEDGIVVVTGAKGLNEPEAEAIVAKRYLVSKGVDEDKILVDNQSYDTYENLNNAYKLIGDKKVTIVSSVYHLFRANYIAKKVGFTNTNCVGSIGNWYIVPHYYAREFFGFVKHYFNLTIKPKMIR